MTRAYYSAPTKQFLQDTPDSILGELVRHHPFDLENLQRDAWMSQIQILKSVLHKSEDSYIAFEYSIPRMGKRVDVILLKSGKVYVLEFKVGENYYSSSAIEQVLGYALDLKNFHEQSHKREIIPILVATDAPNESISIEKYPDAVYHPIKANKVNLSSVFFQLQGIAENNENLEVIKWINSIYKPTPTIIEAAQALYKGHSVKEISRSDSGAVNLTATSNIISEIINTSKRDNKKSICFVTGVPGAGKTLAGLNIANERHVVDEGEHAVFLSGNGPLVEVLQEALARDEINEMKSKGHNITKSQALRKAKTFIQNIHHFRDDALTSQTPPVEKVAIFDEAQRAWNREQTSSFMAKKKGEPDFAMSEPEFLISVLDRHLDWAIVICLIGGGQEINTGEAGLEGWFMALRHKYSHWDIYVSDMITDKEYTNGEELNSWLPSERLKIKEKLHLAVSVRSYRSEKLSDFVKSFLDLNKEKASFLLKEIQDFYPIVITRDINKAKQWLRSKVRGQERCGIVASSGAYRLRPYGIHVKSSIDPKTWFLNDKSDIRSSDFLEEVATEFDIQGLELDWTCVAWDANLRLSTNSWEFNNFKGTKWQKTHKESNQRYLLNSYRVLLTRARQGMVIFIPIGDPSDKTRPPEFYEPIYQYFIQCGVKCL